MIDNNMNFVQLFEQKLSKYTGFKYAVCTDCCTNSIVLSLALKCFFKEIKKSDVINIPKYTYFSIPMTLINYGYTVKLTNEKWNKFYQIGNTNIFDSAADMHENMYIDYNYDALVCISFQQKKRLSLGRGGAILFNNKKYLQYLKRLCYDGRNSSIPYTTELKNNLNDIICGYHCYLEPDKAVQGILKLNQIELLPKYKPVSWKKYPDISTLKFL